MSEPRRMLRVTFRDGRPATLVPVEENYSIQADDQWIHAPDFVVAASEVLTAQIVLESTQLKSVISSSA